MFFIKTFSLLDKVFLLECCHEKVSNEGAKEKDVDKSSNRFMYIHSFIQTVECVKNEEPS